MPVAVVQEYLRYLKKHAGGSVRSNRGRRWPVLTGYSRDRFKVVGTVKFKKNARKRDIPDRIAIRAAEYAPDVDKRATPPITQRVWRRFAKSRERLKAEKATAKRVNRIRPKPV